MAASLPKLVFPSAAVAERNCNLPRSIAWTMNQDWIDQSKSACPIHEDADPVERLREQTNCGESDKLSRLV